MKYVLRPTLEHIALVKIAVTLWNQSDVNTLITKVNFSLHFSDTEWEKIENSVIIRVSKLSLPVHLKKELLSIIKHIGLQIFEWMQYQYRELYLDVAVPSQLCWTPQGTVDRKKTVEILIKDENLDIVKRFKLACIFCLEGNIPELLKKLPVNLRNFLSNGESIFGNLQRNIVRHLACATATMQAQHNGYFSYVFIFESSAMAGNKAATEYFLQKLSPSEKKASLVKTAKFVADADILCFLLLQMDEEQQTELLRSRPFNVLMCFLEWPFQNLFMDTANLVWEFLQERQYVSLLKKIIEKINSGCGDWFYKKLFEEFWQKSPNSLKGFITNRIFEPRIIFFFNRIKHKEIISLIFNDITPALKKKLMYCEGMQRAICFFICTGKLNLLEFYVQECLPTKEERIKFKEEFEKRMPNYIKDSLARIKQKWNKLFVV